MASSSILMYNCAGEEWSKLRQLMMLLRLRLRPVTKEQYAISLGELAVGKGNVEEKPYTGEGFTEPMIVLCNIHPSQLNPILEVVRRADLPCQPLKAMMTPTNIVWDSVALYEELCREREAMEQKKAETTEE